jgi:hypothetical protein
MKLKGQKNVLIKLTFVLYVASISSVDRIYDALAIQHTRFTK